MAGTLYLIPSALGERPWTDYLPAATQAVACRLRRFVVENAKTTRAELKRLGHPLPLRDLAIEQLSERLSPDEIGRLLAPLLAGEDVGLLSEAGCPGVADPGLAGGLPAGDATLLGHRSDYGGRNHHHTRHRRLATTDFAETRPAANGIPDAGVSGGVSASLAAPTGCLPPRPCRRRIAWPASRRNSA